MRGESMAFLRELMETHSPSGYEQAAQKVIRKEMKKYADEVRTDVHGNVIGVKNPNAKFRVMLAGHCDEIGLMVVFIDDDGFLFFRTIGGIDPALTAGQRVIIHGENGPVVGVIGRKPIHLTEPEERGKAVKFERQWIDIGAKNKKDALKVVALGDTATVDVHLLEMRNNLVVSKAFDNKAGAFVVTEALRLVSDLTSDIGVYAVSTVQEELGIRGGKTSAHGINPDAGIAVDVGWATDVPAHERVIVEKFVGDVALGRGPIVQRGAHVNPVLGKLIETTAKKRKIPYQIVASPKDPGTDADVIQITRAGVAAALIEVPNRYMHSPVEVVSTVDMENAAKLIAATIQAMKPGMSFIP